MTETLPLRTVAPAESSARWLMLALLWLLYFSFGLTMGSVAPLVTPILDDLKMSSSQMGLVHGSWQLIYVFLSPPAGAIVDKLGIRRSMGIGISIVWISMVVRGLSIDFTTLILAVSVFGIGGPFLSVGAPKLVSVWFAGRERGLAAGVYATAPPVGLALAFATASSVVLPVTDTWRGVSVVYGVIILLVVSAWWLLARDPGPSSAPDAAQSTIETQSTRSAFASLIRLRNVQVLLFISLGQFVLMSGLSAWAPAILEEKGMTLSQAGLWTAVATIVSIVSVVFVPGLVKHGFRTKAVAVLLLVSGLGAFGMGFFDGPLLLTGLMVFSLSSQPLLPLTTLVLMETPGVGAARMGAAAGLFFSTGELGGFLGPLCMGLLRDATGLLNPGFIMLGAVSVFLISLLPIVRESPLVESRSAATA